MGRILVVLGVTALIMAGVFRAAGWYADNAALPRYCADPATALDHVNSIISGQTEGFADDRRGYVVASKLIFLVPQSEDEPASDYIARLRHEIGARCR